MSLTPRNWTIKHGDEEEYWWFGGSSPGNMFSSSFSPSHCSRKIAPASPTLSTNALESLSRHSPTSSLFMSSCVPTWNHRSNSSPTRSRSKRPRPPPLVLWSIDEETASSEYDVGGLDLGAESPRSTSSSANLLENNAYVRQWAEGRAPYWNSLRRSASFAKERQRSSSQRDDDRDCGICFEYAVRPCRTLCCGKVFCTEHLADWLHGPNAEGRCPNCENACSLVGGTLSLSTPSVLQTPLSPSTKRQTLSPSNYGPFQPSPLTVVQPYPSDSVQHRPPSSPTTERAAIRSRTALFPQATTQSTTSSTSTALSSELAGSSSDEESIRQHYRHLRMKRSFTQLGSASASAINLGTTPFSQSWGAISRLMSIITFLMFIYKLLS